jgi:hypothetical protein
MKKTNSILIFGYVFFIGVALTTLSGCGSDQKEMKENQIRQKFKEMTGLDLPKKVDGLRAVYYAIRDPLIFVRFKTDSEGIADVLKKFSRPDATFNNYDEDDIKRFRKLGADTFPQVAMWQEREDGIHIYDEESLGYGRQINFAGSSLQYTIYIDDQNSTVYILVRTL